MDIALVAEEKNPYLDETYGDKLKVYAVVAKFAAMHVPIEALVEIAENLRKAMETAKSDKAADRGTAQFMELTWSNDGTVSIKTEDIEQKYDERITFTVRVKLA